MNMTTVYSILKEIIPFNPTVIEGPRGWIIGYDRNITFNPFTLQEMQFLRLRTGDLYLIQEIFHDVNLTPMEGDVLLQTQIRKVNEELQTVSCNEELQSVTDYENTLENVKNVAIILGVLMGYHWIITFQEFWENRKDIEMLKSIIKNSKWNDIFPEHYKKICEVLESP